MKLIDFTSAKKIAVTEHFDKLTAALAEALRKSNSGTAALFKKEETLTAEIPELEKVAIGDRESLRTLGEKKTELELVKRQIGELKPANDMPDSELRSLLRQTPKVIETALLPTEESYVDGITKLLLPYCLDGVHAKWMARQTTAAASLASRVHPRFDGGAAIPMARAALRSLQEILTGNIEWSYTPQS